MAFFVYRGKLLPALSLIERVREIWSIAKDLSEFLEFVLSEI